MHQNTTLLMHFLDESCPLLTEKLGHHLHIVSHHVPVKQKPKEMSRSPACYDFLVPPHGIINPHTVMTPKIHSSIAHDVILYW